MIIPKLIEQGLHPDIIDDTNPAEIYLGYFLSDTTNCLIKRITKADAITEIKYPFGKFDFVFDWNQRANYTDWRYRDFPELFNLGYYYNIFSIIDSRNITAPDWRVMNYNDDNILCDYAVPFPTLRLRETGTKYWPLPSLEANNDLGFNARGAGMLETGVPYMVNFTDIGEIASFITTPVTNTPTSAQAFTIRRNHTDIFYGSYDVHNGFTVRLIRNTTNKLNGEKGTYIGNDGRIYGTIVINGKEYTSENLAETRFRNGDEIPTVPAGLNWKTLNTSAKCAFKNLKNYV